MGEDAAVTYELESLHAAISRLWDWLAPLHPNEKGMEVSQIVIARLKELEASNQSAFDQLNVLDDRIETLTAALLEALPFVEDVVADPEQLGCFKPGVVQQHLRNIKKALAQVGEK